MKIVKVKTKHGRTLYGILKNKFLWPTFYSLCSYHEWSGNDEIFLFCLSDDLSKVEQKYESLRKGKDAIKTIIERKCTCGSRK